MPHLRACRGGMVERKTFSRKAQYEPQHQGSGSPPAGKRDRAGDGPEHDACGHREALRERLSRIESRRRKASVEELLAIADRAAAHLQKPYADHDELLYDEHGLPK